MKVVFIGLGRMGVLQARLARYFGDEIVAGFDLAKDARTFFASEFGVDVYPSIDAPDAVSALKSADVAWLTVVDGAIESAAKMLRGRLREACVVFHTSGVKSSRAIADCLDQPVASIHPLVACPPVTTSDDSCVKQYHGLYHVIEGDDSAVAIAQKCVQRVGGKIAQIDMQKKAAYHAAAVFASNYPLTLIDISQKMLVNCGFDELSAREATCRMLSESLKMLQQKSPVDALTGPVKRKDQSTIDTHLKALSAFPYERDVYEALLLATKRMTGWDA